MVNKKQKNKHWSSLFCWIADEEAVTTASVYCNQNLYVNDYNVDEEENENKLEENEYVIISRLYYEPEEENLQEERGESKSHSVVKQPEKELKKSNKKEKNEKKPDSWKPDSWDFTGRSKEEIEEQEERERKELEELRRNTKLKRVERRVYKDHIDYVYVIDGSITSCIFCGSELYGAAIEFEDYPSDNFYGLYCMKCRQFTFSFKEKLDKEWMDIDNQIYEIVPKYIETDCSDLKSNNSEEVQEEEERIIFTGTAIEIFNYLNSGKIDKNSFKILPYYPYEI